MIDNELIKKSTDSISKSLKNKKQIHSCLFELTDILPNGAIDKLKHYIEDSNNQWEIQESYDPDYENLQRKKIAWHADSIIEELHDALEKQTQVASDIVGEDLSFIGVTLWHDSKGFDLGWHTDNPILKATLQIYLFGNDAPGTVFKVNNTEHEVVFESNKGYFAKQNTSERPSHKIKHAVKGERYSLFAMWS